MHPFDKRNNYVDGSYVDVDDFKTEQNFFLEKIRTLTTGVAGNGVVDLKGLKIVPDTVMFEPVPFNAVAVAVGPAPDPTASNPQNFTVVPDSLNTGSENFICYSIFKTNTQNIQKFDLRISLNQALTNENLDIILRVLQLVDSTNPKSPLSSAPPLLEVQLAQNDIPELGSDDLLSLDVSNENSGQGVAVVKGVYYAVQIEFRRPVNSSSNLRLFHSPLNDISSYDSNLLTYVFTGGKYKQVFNNVNGVSQSFVLYVKAETAAVALTAGEALIDGKRTVVEEDQFKFLEIPDRRNVDTNGFPVYNFVVLRYNEVATDPEQIANTRNPVNTRILETATVQVLTTPQWEALIEDQTQIGQYLLLATITDSNIVSLFHKETFAIPSNSTNLVFQDWLNPSNTSPTEEAIILQQARPTDFVFFINNVPSQVPLTDVYGTIQLQPATVRDEFGNVVVRAGDPVLDDIVKVVVNISMDNGKNIRTLELAQVSEIGTTFKFKNYASTISSLSDNPFDNVFSYNFDVDQLAPNVAYNFVAFTKRGLPIYIQDYNRTITTSEGLSSIREQQFNVFLNQGSLTATIEQDLQLGSFNPASDSSQPGVVQFVPSLIQNEILAPLGLGTQNIITDGYLTEILPANSFIFQAPMARLDDSEIVNTDSSVQAAYDVGDITILVDLDDGSGPIDITFSGLTDRDRGGNGAAVLIQGVIDSTLLLSSTSEYRVKVRSADGRDNTNTSSLFSPVGPASVGGPSDVRAFTLIARGKDTMVSPLNVAGYNDGDVVYLYINDQLALDQNYQPITYIFDSNDASISLPSIKHLAPKKYFREKQIKSIQSSFTATPGTVLIDTGYDPNQQPGQSGQVIFNSSEIPSAIIPAAKVYLQYNLVQVVPQDIYAYKTKFPVHGTRDGFRIENANVVSSPEEFISVPEAIALSSNVTNSLALNPSTFQTVCFYVDGINITSLLSPIGQKEIVADNGITLTPGQVAYNPEDGTLKFYREVNGNTVVVDEAPTPFNRLTSSYFKLDTKFVFNTFTTATYEPKFDVNNDGRIDELDLSVVNKALGSIQGEPNYIAAVDFNNDGKVDQEDMDLFQTHFGAVSLGEPDFNDATSARLKALLVARQDNYLETLKVVRAVSRAPDATAPNGRTVLFFDSDTPILRSGNFTVFFGFQASLSLGYTQVEVKTDRPLNGILNLNNIKMFQSNDLSNTRSIVQVAASTLPDTENRFASVLTFSPAVNVSETFTISSKWSSEGIIIRDLRELIIPQKYELLDRKVYGPFKLHYTETDYDVDGTAISFVLRATDATNADGSPDPTGRHILGIPLSELNFTAHLVIPNADGTQSIWTWHHLQPQGIDNKVTLQFDSEHLFIDHQNQGKDKANVLTPFGIGRDQVSLKPKYAGGDLETDLSNISFIRSDSTSLYVKPHFHTNSRDGGILTSKSILFADDLAKLSLLPGSNMTDVVYSLLDIIAEQNRQIEILKSLDGIYRYDQGYFWDDPNLFWDSN